MSSFHALRAWAVRTARHFFGFRWTTARTLTVAMSLALWAGTASADTYDVTVATDDPTGQTAGTLTWAIDHANANTGVANAININLSSGSTLTLSGNLPPIEGTVTINGAGTPGLTINGNGHAAFFADVGTLTIQNMTIANTNAAGGTGGYGGAGGGGGLGAGGALFVNDTATVTVKNVQFQNNAATGGAGGQASPSNSEGAGGGGGFHGNGGVAGPGGGGGGGFAGNGGAAQQGGGGGGGEFGNAGAGGNGASGGGGGGGGGGSQPGLSGTGGAGTSTAGGPGGATGGGTGGSTSGTAATGGTAGGGGGGAGAGGVGGATGANAGTGSTFGGGGGGGWVNGGNSAAGGAFGGGGGGGATSTGTGSGAAGGFGGGGGGASDTPGATGGTSAFGGGSGGAHGVGGNGGNANGGAIFVRTGGTLILENSGISGSSVTGGAGGGFSTGGSAGTAGSADGAALYAMSGFTTDISVDAGTSQTITDSIGGAGNVLKTGAGTLTLSGASDYTGTTEVAGGTLNVTGSLNGSAVTVDTNATLADNGSITGGVTVNQGGLLSGNGSITGNVASNGTVGLANSISVLTINGNYAQQEPGGNAQFLINPSSAPAPGVSNSELVVNGSASVEGTIQITAANGFYTANQKYNLLDMRAIALFNTSATVENVAPSLVTYGIDPNGTGGGTFWVEFNQGYSDFSSYAQTANELAVANYLDNNAGSTDPGMQNLLNTLNTLSPSGVQNALNQMSGAIYGSVAQTDFQSSTLEVSFITRRLGDGLMSSNTGGLARNSYGDQVQPTALASNDSGLVVRGQNPNYWPLRRPTSGWTTWGFGYGLGGNAQGNSNAAGLNYSLGGTVVGLETADNNRIFGAYAGYVGSHLGSYLAGQSIGVNGGQSGLYLRGDDGRNYYILLGGLGADGYNSRRLMQFGGINTTANANYGGWSSQLYFERGLTFQGYKGTIQPYAALQYLYTRQNSFTETGAGVMNLKVNGIDANSLRSLIGVRLAANSWYVNDRAITPVARALWLHEFLSTNTGLNAQFAPIGGGSFAVTGTSLGRDWAILGTGLNWNLGGGWQAYANYDAQVNLVQTFHVGSGGFQYSW